MKYFLTALVVIGLVAVGYMGYSGFFAKVTVTEGVAGPYTFVYQKAIGPYKDCAKPMMEVEKWMKENKLDTSKGFAFYFDNPSKVPQDKLRYVAGCIVEDKSKLKGLKTDFIIRDFRSSKAVIVNFPYKNMLSIYAGVMKVYPAISKYGTEKKLPGNAIMEIYDMKGKVITYVMPTSAAFDGVKLYY